jgi:hypothetical protein
MADLGELTLSTFSPLVGDAFTIETTGGLRIEVTLSEAAAESDQPVASGRTPFSILFSGPPEPILPQGIHRLEHRALGALDVFLVPLQPESGGARYQAVFA